MSLGGRSGLRARDLSDTFLAHMEGNDGTGHPAETGIKKERQPEQLKKDKGRRVPQGTEPGPQINVWDCRLG